MGDICLYCFKQGQTVLLHMYITTCNNSIIYIHCWQTHFFSSRYVTLCYAFIQLKALISVHVIELSTPDLKLKCQNWAKVQLLLTQTYSVISVKLRTSVYFR